MHNGYGHIWVHKEEEMLTFDQLADQVFKNAQAGQPEAIAAIGEIADAQATLQWLATQWERNKRPLAKTNGQQNISPTAIALSQAHHSGRKYGGNCTPKEFNELEKRKNEACPSKRKKPEEEEVQIRCTNALLVGTKIIEKKQVNIGKPILDASKYYKIDGISHEKYSPIQSNIIYRKSYKEIFSK